MLASMWACVWLTVLMPALLVLQATKITLRVELPPVTGAVGPALSCHSALGQPDILRCLPQQVAGWLGYFGLHCKHSKGMARQAYCVKQLASHIFMPEVSYSICAKVLL